jgi:DNA-binding transcriptional MerR regulator
MKKHSLTIGELSRRTGVPVKTLRFWSDEGLLPPATRSDGGYRLYAEDATIRLELVRALRDAGLGLDAVKKVVQNDLSLADALRLQLATVEAHAASLQRVAAALRVALRAGAPNESDLRRLCAVTQLTNDERRTVIERYYRHIAEGIPEGSPWKKLAEAKVPQLPDNPTAEQLDAWLELSELLADESFVERQRTNTREAAEAKLDMLKLRAANVEAARAAAEARAQGASPGSEAGRALVEAFVAGIATAAGKPVTEQLRRGMYERYLAYDPRHARYWELVSIMTGQPSAPGRVVDWSFVAEAVKVHLAPTQPPPTSPERGLVEGA